MTNVSLCYRPAAFKKMEQELGKQDALISGLMKELPQEKNKQELVGGCLALMKELPQEKNKQELVGNW